ncbi:FAD-dependent oxidoreductase [Proteiniphilum sp.]|uniref:FAD-dependent oxidoreductase n=1 Tax=Proteiniphilum sp. TaxID=1926877 RepID=UPI002B20C304|nr:FAD-dependent oxidoreductase [Proteiniphilum sp.]MEA4916199.1 FAD-dependent oxidoreductase [Proteiniphilum sp.]
MVRRNFLKTISAGGTLLITPPGLHGMSETNVLEQISVMRHKEILTADIVIIGGGLGGVASALSSLRNGKRVILTEETDWVGGQLTQQGVPPDEHPWIEHTGSTKTYRDFRNKIRDYYRRNYPLKEHLKDVLYLNPGNASVSRFCHEPRVALAVISELLAPYISSGRLTLLYRHKAINSVTNKDIVEDITVKNILTGDIRILKGQYFVDATELGDLLPLTGTEFVTGSESKKETGELHAPQEADPSNVQAFTVCFAMDYLPGENHVIPRPKDYSFWRKFTPQLKQPWPGKLLDLHYSNPRTLEKRELCFDPTEKGCGNIFNLWSYRRIVDKNNFEEEAYRSDISLVNWPQNDYFLGNLIGASDKNFHSYVEGGKQLSLSLLYWLQTEAPRHDGGKGWPGLRLRKDILGSDDGLAKYPYVRESRRIKPLFTVTEQHVGKENRALVATGDKDKAAFFHDSVGIGYYPIDLHPSTGMQNYIDMDALRFQIPLGALLPIRMKNLIPANKNIGTTHITNGCYRLHPVEWNIGEAVGELLSFSMDNRYTPHQVREQQAVLSDFQLLLRSRGIEPEWPSDEELEKMKY